jgi:hypothetical protein
MLIHDERIQLEDAVLTAELARSGFAAREKIYKLIKGLWDADVVERMVYLKAKYDHDSHKLALERADLALEERQALIEQYELVCAGKSRREIEAARLRYRKAHCAEQAKAIEVAEVDLEFNRQMLESVRSLFAGEVATKTDVILAELDVELEEERLADAKRRTELCRRELARPADQQQPQAKKAR